MPAVAPAVWVAIGSLVVSTAAAVISYNQQKKSARQARQAQAVSQAEQAAQVAAQRKAQVRQERIRKAEIISSAINTGAGMSSGQINATSDIGSLVEGNLSQMNRNENSANQYLSFSQQSADSMSRARMFESISSLAGGVADFAIQRPSAQKSLATIFG